MKKLLTFLLIFCFSFSSFSYDGHSIDEYEIRYIKEAIHLNNNTQYQLRNSNQWQVFLNENPNWFVYFNENNSLPHRAFGPSISTSSPLGFIQKNLDVFNVNKTELILTSSSDNEKYKNYSYTQFYKGLEVLDSRMYIKMTVNNGVVVFGLDVFPDLKLSENPTINKNDAVISASKNLPFSIIKSKVESNLKILPIPVNGKYEFHLVYVVNLTTQNNIGPAEYICYVDANSGDLLMRRNEIKFESLQSNIHVEGEVYTTNPFNASSVENMVDLKVYDISSSSSFFTDFNGDVTLPSSSGSMLISLEGRFSKVMTNSVTPTINTSINSSNNILFDNTNSTIQERTAFWSVNKIHSHFKDQFPNYTGLDFPMETNVDIGLQGGCNAFYSGGTINFYEEDGGCQATANIPDVCFHEYGHAINDYRYNNGASMWNGGLNEGTADIWALSLTQYPILGEGWETNDPNSNVRSYNGLPKVYPQDLVGEVHADGEIICGAFWDTYLNLGDMQQALDLFTDLYDAGPDGPNGTEGIIYTDVLLEFLYSDDDDGNIFNGTPNDNAIVDAFAKHGITLLSNAVLTHTELDESIQQTSIDVDANITMSYPWALDNAFCYYKLNDATIWDSVPLVLVSGSDFSAQLPSQVKGTVIAYYLSITDTYGKKAAITPFSANLNKHANLPYFILVGYELQEEQDFDFNIGFWSTSDANDNATTGLWEIGVPEGSFYDGTIPVQTPTQHTDQGVYCAFTGNDITGGSIGANDVDAGHTTLTSPVYDLKDYSNPTFSYYRWYTNSPPTGANPAADWWQVLVSDDGTNWVYIENNITSDNRWRKFSFRVKDYVNITDNFSIKFIASDSIRLGQNLDGGSLVEAAIDDVYLFDENSVNSIENTSINMELFPNPTKGIVYVTTSEDYLLKVYNTLGELILEQKLLTNKSKIDLTNEPKGIYYLEFYSSEIIETKKIVLE